MDQPYGFVTESQVLARVGRKNPYEGPLGQMAQLVQTINSSKHTEGIASPVLGSEAVLSWHATPALAQKALNSHDNVASQGDRLTIRTDITIVEKGR